MFPETGKSLTGDGKIVNLFYSMCLKYVFLHVYLYCSTCVPALYIVFWYSRIRYPIVAVHCPAIPMHFYEVLLSACPAFAIESGNLIYVKCNAYPYPGMTFSQKRQKLRALF
jgi:hypothetical protein